jgi:lipopolysaccharide exporter
MIAARWAMRLIGLVSTMILARILAPQDFGLVAMVMIAYGLFETISYAAVDLALMRGETESREHFDTAWTIQMLQGAFVAVGVVVTAPLVASYFDEPRALLAMLLVAPKALIDGAQNIGVVWFRKDLDFAKEFRFTLYSRLLAFVIVIALALWLRSYWALILGQLAASVITVGMSYAMHPYRPRLTMSKARDLWSFSQWLIISRFGTYLNRKCDAFIVGGAIGTSAMGTYHVSTELATLPSNELVMPIRRALFPSLARIASDGSEFAKSVADSFASVSAVCLLTSAVMWVVAVEFVSVVLGSQWQDAAPLIRTLAIYGGASSLVLILEVPLWVAGKTHLSAAQAWIELALLAPLTVLAVQADGAQGAAAVRAGVAIAMVPIMVAFTVRAGNVDLRLLARAAWRPSVAAVAAAAIASWVPWSWVPHVVLLLGLKAAACVVAYVLILVALWQVSGRPAGFEGAAMAALQRWRRT